MLRDAGATGLSCQDGACKLLMHFPHPCCARMSFSQHTLGPFTLLLHPAPAPTALSQDQLRGHVVYPGITLSPFSSWSLHIALSSHVLEHSLFYY